MKKFFYLCTALLLTLTKLQAEDNSFITSCEKVYVTPGSVYVSADAIYLFMNDCFLPVENLSKDERGVFAILSSDARVGYCPKCNKKYNGHLRDHLDNCPANKNRKV